MEVNERYDNRCVLGDPNCRVDISIDKKMDGTVHVYYELHNFYQNNRLYMKSLSRTQLGGKKITDSNADSSCDPVPFLKDFSNLCRIIIEFGPGKKFAINNPTLRDEVAYPCGLIAQSVFTGTIVSGTVDKFRLQTRSGNNIQIEETNIAWNNDRKDYENYNTPSNWHDMSDGITNCSN